MCMKSRCQSPDAALNRPASLLPRGVHMLGLECVAARRTLMSPPRIPALTRSRSVSLALAPVAAKPSAAVTIAELCR